MTLLNEIFGRDAKEAIKATRSLFGLLLVEHDHGETGGTSLADLRCERGAVLPDKGLIVEVEEEVRGLDVSNLVPRIEVCHSSPSL